MAGIVLFRPKYVDVNLQSYDIPWGLLYVSSILVKEGYSVRIIDEFVTPDWQDLVLEEIAKKPIIFGVSSMTGIQIKYGLNFASFVKKFSDIPVVWGGIHSSLLPAQTLKNQNVDFAVIGDGEETIVELVRALEEKSGFDKIKGLAFKQGSEIFINDSRPMIELDNIPVIPYDLIDMNSYFTKRLGRKRVITMLSSRGCLHRCKFCYNNVVNNRTWRSFSLDRIFGNLHELIEKYNIDGVFWTDDNFFQDKKRVNNIAERIIKEKIDIKWGAQGRIDYLHSYDQDFIDLLKGSGLHTVNLGVESGSDRVLKAISKDITRQQVIEVKIRLTKNDIYQNYFFMFGFPGETDDDIFQTAELIYQLISEKSFLFDIYGPSLYTPYPGTELFDESVKMGFKPANTLEGWIKMNWLELNLPWFSRSSRTKIENISWNIRGVSSNFGPVIFRYFLFKLFLLVRLGVVIPCFEKNVLFFGVKIIQKIKRLLKLNK